MFRKARGARGRRATKLRTLPAMIAGLFGVVAAIAALSFSYADEAAVSSDPNLNYGTYTFVRNSEYDGEILEFYESGDEAFRYYHDENGYVLLRNFETGAVNYAYSDGGYPIDSGVSLGADAARIATVEKMTVYDFSDKYVQSNSVAVYDRQSVGNTAGETANLIIFIEFADSTADVGDRIEYFNGLGDTLQSYYLAQSDGAIDIKSYYPIAANGAVYVYKDSRNRSYYNISDTSGIYRQNREAELLTNAVAAAKAYLSLPQGSDLDVDDDGYIDSVSFLIAGSSENDWGGLLWPHSWNLDDIDGSSHSEIGGVKVGDYSFNFLDSMTLGLLAHETAHVFGAPDLYHSSQDFAPVGAWCLMQQQDDTPQYMLTYLRENYIGGLAEDRIGDITATGTYRLQPVDSAEGRIAYRIYTDNPDEYFMVEYRKQRGYGFESELPGSGLIVYRVREPESFENSTGNINAVYRGTGSRADEVFVFRPSVSRLSDLYDRSFADLTYAWLSPYNRDFHTVGSATSTADYDSEAIYYSDGENSGLVITATAISDEEITFDVSVPGENVSDSYFRDKFFVESAAFVNSTDYSGLSVSVGTAAVEPAYIESLEVAAYSGNTEVARVSVSNSQFAAAYESGRRRFEAAFIVNDKGNGTFDTEGRFYTALPTAEEPDTVRVSVIYNGRTISITSATVDDSAVGWNTVVNTQSQTAAGIFASGDMTLGIGADGVVDVSGADTDGKRGAEGFSGAVTAAVGYSHSVVVDTAMRVHAFGTNYYGESDVSDWNDIIAAAAGYHVTYVLHADGRVSGTGLNSHYVAGWTGVRSIAAGLRHVVAVKTDGTLLWGGNNSYGQLTGLNEIKNAVAVTAGDDFTAILLSDGTVTVKGGGFAEVSDWTNVKKIVAGSRHLLALTYDGQVLSAGDNGYGQCETAGLDDIIDVAAGDAHSAFLRADGTVLYRGAGDQATSGIANLIYSDYEPVAEISVSRTEIFLAKGETATVSFSVLPETATYKKLAFTLSAEGVFKYSAADGVISVTGRNEGTATIRISAYGGEAVTVITVNVMAAAEGIAFDSDALKLFVGERYSPVAHILPQGGYHSEAIVYTLEPGSSDYVTFENGVLIATAEGDAVLVAKLGNFRAELDISVVRPESVKSLTVAGKPDEVNPTEYYYGEEFDPGRYNLTVVLQDGTTTDYPLESLGVTIAGFDPYAKGAQIVEIAYSGAVCQLNVNVKDYIIAIAPTAKTLNAIQAHKQLYNSDLPGGEQGTYSYIATFASGETETRYFQLNALQGYDKEKTGPQTLTYLLPIAEHNGAVERPEFAVTVNVYDYATGITYTPTVTNIAFGGALPAGEYAEVKMATGAVQYMELDRLTVVDTAEEFYGILSSDSPYYSFNSLIAGEHRLTVTYTDPALAARGENAEISCTVTFTVAVVPNYYTEGTYFTDGGTRYYVYPVGGEYDMRLLSEQGDMSFTAQFAENSDNALATAGGLFYSRYLFDNSVVGESVGSFDIFYVYQSYSAGGEPQRAVRELVQYVQINFYGYSSAAEIALVPEKAEYEYGETINAKFTLTEGADSFTFPTFVPEYDRSAVGTVTLTAEFLGNTYTATVNIPDRFELETIQDFTVIYGEAVNFEVWAVSAITGERYLLSSDDYVVRGSLSATEVGSRTITIAYAGAETSLTFTVVDPIDEVSVLTPPKTSYTAGEYFDPDSEYVLTWRSGAKMTVAYSETYFYVAPNPDEYPFGGVNDGRVFTIYYDVEYGEDIVVWIGETALIRRPETITVAVVDDYVFVGKTPNLRVSAVFSDGTSVVLSRGDYTVEFDSSAAGYITGTVRYSIDDSQALVAEFTVRVIRKPAAVTLTPPVKVDYGYGEAIDWSGASAAVSYEDGGGEIVYGSGIKAFFDVIYDPTATGRTAVTVSLGGVSAAFNVYYGAKARAVDCADTDFAAVDLENERIVLFAPGMADAARAVINSYAAYLTAQYYRKDGTLVLDYTLPAMTGDELRLSNADGTAVIIFKISVRGDTDGDGLVTQNDIFGMADSLIGGGGAEFDFNGDGKSTLSDLINYQQRVPSERAPAPLRQAAEAFVAPVSGGFGRKKYV